MTLPQLSNPRLAPATPGRTVVLANWRAGRVNRAAMCRIASRLRLEGTGIREVGPHGSARALAEEAVRRGVRCIVTAGGDGTLHEIIQVIAGTPTALGILPLGTSNDLARRLGIPEGLDRALSILHAGTETSVDLLKIGRHRVATVGGFGLPAHVARECNEFRARPTAGRAAAMMGGIIYSVGAALRIMRRGAQPAVYDIGAGQKDPSQQRASAILVGLTERFGGGLALSSAPPAPGTFAALIVTASTRPRLLQTLVSLRCGGTAPRWTARYTGLERLEIRTRSLVGAFGDGEWLGLRHRVVIASERAALRVIVPRASQVTSNAAAAWQEAM